MFAEVQHLTVSWGTYDNTLYTCGKLVCLFNPEKVTDDNKRTSLLLLRYGIYYSRKKSHDKGPPCLNLNIRLSWKILMRTRQIPLVIFPRRHEKKKKNYIRLTPARSAWSTDRGTFSRECCMQVVVGTARPCRVWQASGSAADLQCNNITVSSTDPRDTYWRGRLSTIDVLINIAFNFFFTYKCS